MVPFQTAKCGECRLPRFHWRLPRKGSPFCICHRPRHPGRAAVTLIELLCVIVIMGILASLLLPGVLRAYLRAKEFDEEMEGGAIVEMIRNESRNYCVGHPTFQFSSKADFAQKCVFAPKPSAWIESSRTDFVPFSYLDPTNRIVVSLHYGRNQANYHAFTRGELSLPAE